MADPAPKSETKSDIKSDLKSEAGGVAGEVKSDAAITIDALKKEENMVKKSIVHKIEKMGVTIGIGVKNGKVTYIWPASDLLGKIYVGDMIESVNGKTPIKNTADFLKGVNLKLPGETTIELKRDEHCTITTKPLAATKPNTELMEISLNWRGGGTPLGLLIHRDYQKRVVIGVVDGAAPIAKVVKAGDFLLKVNGTGVSDRNEARKLIADSINIQRKVILTLERPLSDAAVVTPASQSPSGTALTTIKSTTDAAAPAAAPAAAAPAAAPAAAEKKEPAMVSADADYTPTVMGAAPPSATAGTADVKDDELISTPPAAAAAPAAPAPPPKPEPKMPVIDAKVNKKIDVALAADVIQIMEENKLFFKVKCILPPCLKPKGTDKCALHTEMTAEKIETQIPYDASKKALKTTPKRVGS